MTAVAIYSRDADLRARIDQLLRAEPSIVTAGTVADSQAVGALISGHPIDVLLADMPAALDVEHWRHALHRPIIIVLVDECDDDALEAMYAGADGVIPRSAGHQQLLAAIEAAAHGLAVLPHGLINALLDVGTDDLHAEAPEAAIEARIDNAGAGHSPLTRRELEVLAAMADGASNKAIARRLGISYHTVKFHVAAVLTKLDADTRTEAVAKAAHLGLVML
jgi:DNA-binding NarL/FixJ family response regulator